MLFVSARNKADAYTVAHVLQKDHAADGGRFLPVQIPRITAQQLQVMQQKNFSQCVAEVLNMFFNARLDANEVDFCIGKHPVRIVAMSHKILVAEQWHNPSATLSYSAGKLVQRILNTSDTVKAESGWPLLCVQIAFLFGLYGQMHQTQKLRADGVFDVAVDASDFTGPVAAWYARKMGLPIRTIVCGCKHTGELWDLMCHGTAADASLIEPEVEQYIYHILGQEEAKRFAAAYVSHKPYSVTEEQCQALQDGLFTAVVGSERATTIINSVYRTNSYLLEPDSALAYAGLQDYRAGADETFPALILMKRSAAACAEPVADALGISETALQQMIRDR